MLEMEKGGEKYSGPSRTFKLHNGFHSCNLLDKNRVDLEKFHYTSILISRVQEILHNHFKSNVLNISDSAFCIKIKEIWFNILRKQDYNLPHNHPGNNISGNFYIKVPESKSSVETDGTLIFLKKSSHHTYVPADVYSKKYTLTDASLMTVIPQKGSGIIFQSHLKHIVMPHFSDEDRIGIAFNAVIVPALNFYWSLYPKPYWNPNRIVTKFVEEPELEDGCISIRLAGDSTCKLKISMLKDSKGFNLKESYQLVGQTVTLGPSFMNQFCTVRNYTIDHKEYFNLADDYFTSKHEDLWGAEDHFFFEENTSDTLLVVFAGMGIQNKPPTFIFHNSLLKYKCDKLFLRDFSRTWFMSNPKTGKSLDGLMKLIRTKIKPRHKRLITIGASSGGFTSILVGHLMGMHECIAFAPQTTIDPVEMGRMGDNRWENNARKVVRSANKKDRKYFNLKKITSSKAFRMKTTIYLTAAMDEKHADLISSTNPCITKNVYVGKQKYSNPHLTALIMKQEGDLQPVFDGLGLELKN